MGFIEDHSKLYNGLVVICFIYVVGYYVIFTSNPIEPSLVFKFIHLNIKYVGVLHCLFTLYLFYLLKYIKSIAWIASLVITIIIFFLINCLILFFGT